MAGFSKLVATILLMLMLRRGPASRRAAGSRGYASVRATVVPFAIQRGLAAAIAVDSVAVASAPDTVN
ncbi:hypothetical protein H5410_000054 [Solanum commersonii]|uniref:Uncharacterized protein n=1 Tax=Solanum commersonii TaxID=4109 RepID=A0A9J6AVE9_SOLCO|nr:hypothetical protein H5410_000054 [Solanum commersonii]